MDPIGLPRHIRETVALAAPVTVGRIGILVLVAVDTAMTGHAGASELAYYAVGLAPQVTMVLIGVGLLMGTVVLTAQAAGAGRERECGAVWRVALGQALLYGAVLALATLAGERFLLATGQSPAVAAGAGRVMVMLGLGLPGMLLYTATTLFLEGINRPLPGMLAMLAANGVNAALNWVFIYGHLGAPALGAEGAALATTVARWFLFAATALYVLLAVDPRRYGTRERRAGRAAVGRRLLRLGLPLGIAHGLESGAFATMVLLAGLLGPGQVAGYQIAMNLLALVFMCAVGFATAASVRVGQAIGRRDRAAVRTAGWTAVGTAGVVQAACAAGFALAPGVLAAVYSDDPAVTAVAIPTIAVGALALLPDGMQGVVIGALRGTGDVWPATGLYLLAFWGVMVPAGYLLGVGLGLGAPGLMGGVLAGTVSAALLLSLRFQLISARLPAPR